EFARSMPLLDLGLASVGGTSLDARVEPMAIVVSASVPASAIPWTAPEREFPEPGIELGELARLDLVVEKEPAAGSNEPAVRNPVPEEPGAVAAVVEIPAREIAPPVPQSPPPILCMPIVVDAIVPGRGRPLQVFSTPLFS